MRIGVAVKDGVVTLSGEVESYHGKVEAERATLRVEGVRGVASEIEIHLPGTSHRSDADIARVALDNRATLGAILRYLGLVNVAVGGFMTQEH